MYYAMNEDVRKNLAAFMSVAPIAGKDAQKAIQLAESIKVVKHAPYYKIDDAVAKWAAETLNGVTIAGRYAAILLECYLSLSKPIETLPTVKPVTSAVPPKPKAK